MHVHRYSSCKVTCAFGMECMFCNITKIVCIVFAIKNMKTYITLPVKSLGTLALTQIRFFIKKQKDYFPNISFYYYLFYYFYYLIITTFTTHIDIYVLLYKYSNV